MQSQTAIATLGTLTSCPPDTVLVPLNVANYEDVAAMTYEIAYDTNTLEYLGLQNINPAVPGNILSNAVNGEVLISWSFITGFYLSNDKLFDLSFSYISDSSELHWHGIEISNSALEILPVDTIPGGVYNQISISHQPDSTQAYPGSNVSFLITASGNTGYQWQENTGSGWVDLENVYPYSGVNSFLLTVNAVTLSFNGNLYRCHLFSDECELDSDQALLEVATAFPEATIGTELSCPVTPVLVPFDVFDFNDIIEFTFNISFDENVLTFVSLQNNHQLLSNGLITTAPLTGAAGVSIHWTTTGGPINFGEIKLFDMNFDYTENESDLAFVEGTLVLNSFSNPVDIDLYNGSVSMEVIPQISGQPEDLTVEQGEEATFTVMASGVNDYLWQVSEDNGNQWSNLLNFPPYSGVTDHTLMISGTPLSFDGNLYRCSLDNSICVIYSQSAKLTVDSLQGMNQIKEGKGILISPNPSAGEFRIKIDEDFGTATDLKIFDLAGREVMNVDLSDRNFIIKDSELGEGMFFGVLNVVKDGRTAVTSFKLIKTIN